MESEPNQSKTEQNKENESPEPIVSQTSVGQKLETEKASDNNANSAKPNRPYFWVSAFRWVKRDARATDWIIAVFTIVIAGVAYFQYTEMDDAGRQTDKMLHLARGQLKEQHIVAEAANSAADSAAKGIKATQDAMRHDQRAWVGSGDAKVVITGKELKAEVTLKNVGKTPAIEVFSNISWIGKEKGKKLQLSDISYPAGDVSNGTMFPEQTNKLQNKLPDPVPPYQEVFVEKLKRGDSTLYVFGKINYRDIFRVPHWTHFCMIVDADLVANSPCAIYTDSDPDPVDKEKRGQNPN